MCARPLATVLELAAANGGLVGPSDLRKVGLRPQVLWRLARTGEVVRLRRGLYTVVGAPTGDDVLLAQLACELGAVISHQSAAKRYGVSLTGSQDRLLHLTVRRPRQVDAPPGIRVHGTLHLRVADVRRHEDVSVTSPCRTLVDLGAPSNGLADRQLVDILDHLLSTRRLSAAALQVYLRDVPRLPGVARVRRIVAGTSGERVDSAAERQVLRLLARAGIESPCTQFELRDDAGRLVARLDHAWPTQRVALEVDGYRYHSGTQVFRQDRERGNRIQSLGWQLYRTTPAELADGAPDLVAALRRALGP